jgi:hypothetical protein
MVQIPSKISGFVQIYTLRAGQTAIFPIKIRVGQNFSCRNFSRHNFPGQNPLLSSCVLSQADPDGSGLDFLQYVYFAWELSGVLPRALLSGRYTPGEAASQPAFPAQPPPP